MYNKISSFVLIELIQLISITATIRLTYCVGCRLQMTSFPLFFLTFNGIFPDGSICSVVPRHSERSDCVECSSACDKSSTGKSSSQSNTVSRNLPLLAMKIIHVTTAMHNLNALYGLVILPASSSSSSSSTPVTSVLQSYCRHHFIMHILSVKK